MRTTLTKTVVNYFKCIKSLIEEMTKYELETALVINLSSPPNGGLLKIPLLGYEQADFLKIFVLKSQEIKVQYRKIKGNKKYTSFVLPVKNKEQIRILIDWFQQNKIDIPPEQFRNHYSDMVSCLGCE